MTKFVSKSLFGKNKAIKVRSDCRPFFFADVQIGQFGKYHSTLCLCPQILHKHCFQFLLGITMVRRENKNNAYAKFGGTNKEYYGIFRTGLFAAYASFPWKLNRYSYGVQFGINCTSLDQSKLSNFFEYTIIKKIVRSNNPS